MEALGPRISRVHPVYRSRVDVLVTAPANRGARAVRGSLVCFARITRGPSGPGEGPLLHEPMSPPACFLALPLPVLVVPRCVGVLPMCFCFAVLRRDQYRQNSSRHFWSIGYTRGLLITIGYCRVSGQAEGRIGGRIWVFQSARDAVPENVVQSCGYNRFCTPPSPNEMNTVFSLRCFHSGVNHTPGT